MYPHRTSSSAARESCMLDSMYSTKPPGPMLVARTPSESASAQASSQYQRRRHQNSAAVSVSHAQQAVTQHVPTAWQKMGTCSFSRMVSSCCMCSTVVCRYGAKDDFAASAMAPMQEMATATPGVRQGPVSR